MPFAPKILHGCGAIGIHEVFAECEAERAAKANGHVAVTGKVKVYLHQIAYRAKPCYGRVYRRAVQGKNLIRRVGKSVRNKHLFAHAEAETPEPRGNILRGNGALLYFCRNVAVAHYRPRYKLREKRNVQKHVRIVCCGLRIPALNVQNIAYCLKREKRYANRQRYIRHRNGKMGKRIEALH